MITIKIIIFVGNEISDSNWMVKIWIAGNSQHFGYSFNMPAVRFVFISNILPSQGNTSISSALMGSMCQLYFASEIVKADGLSPDIASS